MGVISVAVRHLFAAGLSADDIISAIEDMEASAPAAGGETVSEARRRKRERDAERMRQKRHSSDVAESRGDTSDASDVALAGSPSPALPPRPPNPPTPTPGSNYAHEGTGDVVELIPKPPKPDKRGARLAETWAASATDRQYAASQGLSPEETNRVETDFRDYWIARPGAGGVKLDWPATWRTWVRRHCERRGGGGQGVARFPNPGGGGRGIVGTGEIIARRHNLFDD